jgi:hypothetical protein
MSRIAGHDMRRPGAHAPSPAGKPDRQRSMRFRFGLIEKHALALRMCDDPFGQFQLQRCQLVAQFRPVEFDKRPVADRTPSW